MTEDKLEGTCFGSNFDQIAAECIRCLVKEQCWARCSKSLGGCMNILDERPVKRGRKQDIVKRGHIIALARANNTLSMAAIARHVGCSEALVSKVFDDKPNWELLDR